MFVNISNLKLIPPQRPERKTRRVTTVSSHGSRVTNGNKSSDISRSSDISSIEEEVVTGGCEADQLELYPVTDPQINDRVVWIGESGYERATIKWIGCLPTDDTCSVQHDEILVGVEFVSVMIMKTFCADCGAIFMVYLCGRGSGTADFCGYVCVFYITM